MASRFRALSLVPNFWDCGNPLFFDARNRCSYRCVYCYSQTHNAFRGASEMRCSADRIDSIFNRTRQPLLREMLDARVPLHVGVRSDPFGPLEDLDGLTERLLLAARKAEYPIIITTKSIVSDHLVSLCHPGMVAWQISVMGASDKYVSQYDTGAPPASERMDFARSLVERGFWTGIRIQPIIDVEQACATAIQAQRFADFATVELLTPWISHGADLLSDLKSAGWPELSAAGRRIVPPAWFVSDVLNRIRAAAPHLPVSCGNAQCRGSGTHGNCCGIETMPRRFGNWIGYTASRLADTGDFDCWSPKSPITWFQFSRAHRSKCVTWKDRVDLEMAS